MSNLSYRPEVDGLRTIAILPVILFHLGYNWISGGFLGVDVFFVISGYLISSMILKDLADGTFTFHGFWARRVRRIMPALLVVVLFTLVASFIIVFRPQAESIGWDAVSAALSWANINMMVKFGDYWGQAAESSPFLHAWSLSVEEQFYLVFPLLLWGLSRLKAKTGPILALLGLVSLALFVGLSVSQPTFTFYMLPTRAWELVAGSLVAVYGPRLVERVPHLWRAVATAAGLLLIVVSYFIIDGSKGIDPLSSLAVLGASAVILFSGRQEPTTQVLSSKPFVFVGKISYSLYLWHWPVIILAGLFELRYQYYLPKWVVVPVIVVLAIASYFLVEQPLRKSKRGVWVSLALLVVALGTSAALIQAANVPYSLKDYQPVVWYGTYYNVAPQAYHPDGGSSAEQRTATGESNGMKVFKADPKNAGAYSTGGLTGGTRKVGERADLVVIGDSHGSMWAKTLDEIGENLSIPVTFFTTIGNDPFFTIPLEANPVHGKGFTDEEFATFARGLLANLEQWKPKLVVLAAKWSSKDSSDFVKIQALAQYCSDLRIKVLFLDQPPVVATGDNNSAQFLAFLEFKPSPDGGKRFIGLKNIDKVKKANQLVRDIVQKIPGTELFSVYARVAKGKEGWILDGRDVLYRDDDHLSYQGTSRIKAELQETISKLLE